MSHFGDESLQSIELVLTTQNIQEKIY